MPAFTKVHLVRKLNDTNSSAVNGMVDIVTFVAWQLSIPIVPAAKLDENSLVLALGGDGTMLCAMQLASRTDSTAYGINLGNVGFLTELSTKDPNLLELITQLIKGENQRTEHRLLLSTTTPSSTGIAVNEISISQMYADAMIKYNLEIGETEESLMDAGVHQANSLLISTPTGSTAYSLSAGGVLMTPSLKAIQIVPVAPTRLTSRPIITSGGCVIRIKAWGDSITVRSDGQIVERTTEKFTEQIPFVVTVKRYPTYAKVIHMNGWNFFDTLEQKLGWIKQ